MLSLGEELQTIKLGWNIFLIFYEKLKSFLPKSKVNRN